MTMTQTMSSNESALRELTGAGDANVQAGDWLVELREAARKRFVEVGFPGRRDEEWRYTNITPIVETVFHLATNPGRVPSPAELTEFGMDDVPHHQLTFVDGFFRADLSTSLPAGLTLSTLAEALKAGDPAVRGHFGKYASASQSAFVALNTATAAQDGGFLHVRAGQVVEEPIHLLFVTTGVESAAATHPRTLIVIEDRAQATIVESYVGLGSEVSFTNAVTEVVCGKECIVDHYKVQRESLSTYHVATLQIQLAERASFSSHSLGFGGAIVRNDVNAGMWGEYAECTVNGLYMAKGNQLVDNHTFIDHALPNCPSHEVYKGILDGDARGVFNGKILVRQDAQKTDAKQTNKTLLLSPGAQINTKPQLEIYADDVKCTHGATVGQLSDEALFYLRSRGIGKEQAESLLTYAFASDIVSRIKVEPIRAQLDHLLLEERALEGM